MRYSLAALLLVVLVLAGCGGDDASSTTESEPPAATSTSSATTTSTAAPTTTAATTTTTEATTTTWAGVEGEPYDFWVPVPEEGPILGVVGVQFDDVLNVRSGPNVSFDVVTTLDPTQTGISGTGEGWQLPSGAVWWQIDAGGVEGWINQQFMSRLSDVDDITSFVVAQMGQIPTAETMLELGLQVAEVFADVDVGSEVVVSVAPTVGDLGEVTYDVTGLGDDSEGGIRLHVFGQPTDSGEAFSLMAVEATRMCQRGVSEGRCV
ncbi:MAG TPA: SH3 domain-containing protein [Acidimicrobiia bacterium]|jgi:hypothetical protein|nr:SH3 domain-containing protein [Acidimicrobiia bacterium]